MNRRLCIVTVWACLPAAVPFLTGCRPRAQEGVADQPGA